MNRTGILIDLSHTGDRSSLEAIETSTMPVSFTHANARSQDDHPRNKTDEAIKALVERGGVIGANAFPMFLPAGYDSGISDYVDRIDFLVDMVGVDAVAIGTDFCQAQPKSWFEWIFSSQGSVPAGHVPHTPEPYRHLRGMEGTLQFESIAVELDRRGYVAADVKKIIGGNWLRLFGEVWSS
jgi:membrane dipeptidase